MSNEDIKRKLTTILAADVVGYSRLMAEDEEATLKTLRKYRQIIDDLIAKHQGRVFNTAGDAVLVEFGSAVEGVRCAISIQEELRVRNAELAEERQMTFRIGVNVGDVMIEHGDLFGDGVNVAARLEGLAEAGGVCISGSTFDQVKNKLSIGFEDMGPQEVKNIPQPVPAFRLVSGPITVTSEAPSRKTVAVEVPPPKAGRSRMPVIALAVVVVIGALAAAVWTYYPRGPLPLTSFPANFSTDTMLSGDIEAFMAGMKIQGIAKKDGRPWTMQINADKTVDLEKGRAGTLAGTTFRETGKWWAENYRFCMQFNRFRRGRKMCPRIIRNGEKISATRGDGSPLEWSLGK